MNPEKVSAGGDAYSKYSLALRKAIYELICAYKYEYIQENTEPITSVMPITSRFYSDTPETTDTTEALENAKRLLCEAGYIWKEENGTFDTAFTDSTMKFEFLCCASHSAAAPVRAVADTLASLGFEIAVTEAADMEMLAPGGRSRIALYPCQ